MSEEDMIKGSVIKGYLKGIKKKWGKAGLEKFEADTGIKEANLKDGEYYPRENVSKTLRWISENHGIETVRKLGRLTVQNLGIYKYLVMWSSMERLVTRAVNIYGELYTYGTMRSWFEDDKIIVQLKDDGWIEEDCYGWWGALEGLMDLTHTKGTVTETKCPFKGDAICEFTIELD